MIIESIKMAVSSLLSNKLRSLLTMLGIIVGISSVIAIMSLGEGGKDAVLGQFYEIGATTVQIQVKSGLSEHYNITKDDLQAIRKHTDVIKYASAVDERMGSISFGDKRKTAVVIGIDADYTNINSMKMISGRRFSETEYDEGRNTVIVDEATANALFGGADGAVGEKIQLSSRNRSIAVTVVGVYQNMAGAFANAIPNQDQMPAIVFIPSETAAKVFNTSGRFDNVIIMANSAEQVEAAGDTALRVLSMRHNAVDVDIYRKRNLVNVLDQFNSVLAIITGFISAVAAISLLVGGIGVMNIMFVSVTERTREIGIRKAIGARTRDIMNQFIIESVVITSVGGIIGLACGVLAATLIGNIAGIVPVITVKSILLSVLFSGAVGLFFGIYPARKAAKLDPIVALRYEN